MTFASRRELPPNYSLDLPRFPNCTKWLAVGRQYASNSRFNLAASSFSFPPFPLQFLLLFSIFLDDVDTLLLVSATKVAAIRPPNIDHHLQPRSHSHPRNSPIILFRVSQVSPLPLTRRVHPFSSRSESAGGCGRVDVLTMSCQFPVILFTFPLPFSPRIPCHPH
jgi:hypothetical protein